MTTFKLMRKVTDTPDIISRTISESVREKQDRLIFAPRLQAGLFFMNFWNMKARGELHESETPAVWAVMMRAVDASTVVRLVLDHAWLERTMPMAGLLHAPTLQRLHNFMTESLRNSNGALKPQQIAKLRGNLLPLLKACERLRGSTWTTLCASDADLLLRACQTAVEVKKEDDKRWARMS